MCRDTLDRSDGNAPRCKNLCISGYTIGASCSNYEGVIGRLRRACKHARNNATTIRAVLALSPKKFREILRTRSKHGILILKRLYLLAERCIFLCEFLPISKP